MMREAAGNGYRIVLFVISFRGQISSSVSLLADIGRSYAQGVEPDKGRGAKDIAQGAAVFAWQGAARAWAFTGGKLCRIVGLQPGDPDAGRRGIALAGARRRAGGELERGAGAELAQALALAAKPGRVGWRSTAPLALWSGRQVSKHGGPHR